MCFAFTALHALRDGYEVYGLIDAGGDATPAAHKYGIKRMVQAGVVPLTWMPLVSDWMHDWGNPNVDDLKEQVWGRYDAMLAMWRECGDTSRISGPHRARQDRQRENGAFRTVNMERQKWLTANG
jgi:hypothetical protein